MVETPHAIADPMDVGRLRNILRGLRSRKPSVREWALHEAKRLDRSHQARLNEMVERSLSEEGRRRRFWRFMAFYGSPFVAGILTSALRRWVPGFQGGLGGLAMLGLWLPLWSMADRAAKSAFVLPVDGRVIWKHHEAKDRPAQTEESHPSAMVTELASSQTDTSLLGSRPDVHPAELDIPLSDLHAFVADLTSTDASVQEAAQRKAVLLSDTALWAAARLIVSNYEECAAREDRQRSGLTNKAFWIFVGGVFLHIMPWLAITLSTGIGLYALYGGDQDVNRHLEALVVPLQELMTRQGTPASLDRLTLRQDLTVAARMERRCPALKGLLVDRASSAETSAVWLSDAEKETLREMSAEVLLAPFDNVEDTLAALKRLEEIGDETVIDPVQRLAAHPLRFVSVRAPLRTVQEYRQDAQRIREAAQSCLDSLRARSDVQQRTLLRSAAAAPSDTLLRPVQASPGDTRPEELLRASAAETQPAEPVESSVYVEPRVYGRAEEPVQAELRLEHSGD